MNTPFTLPIGVVLLIIGLVKLMFFVTNPDGSVNLVQFFIALGITLLGSCLLEISDM